MAIQVQIRRGTTTQNNAFTGAVGELTVDTTKDTVVVHDGSTAGGFPLLKENNPSYTGTLTGGTGVINIGSGQLYKDASGNVGIGTSSPAVRVHAVNSAVSGASYRVGAAPIIAEGNGSCEIQVISDGISQLRFGNGSTNFAGAVSYEHSTNSLVLFGNSTERMRIDSAGNVGIGTSSPSSLYPGADNLVVGGGSGDTGITVFGGTSGIGSLYFADGTSGAEAYRGWVEYRHASDSLNFGTGASERMRIDSSGNLLVGTTSNSENSRFVFYNPSGRAGYLQQADTDAWGLCVDTPDNYIDTIFLARNFRTSGFTNFNFFVGQSNGASRIQIRGDGNLLNTNNSYGAISDVKLKENIVDATPKLDKLNQVRIVNFNIIGEEQKQIGVIAQELEQVFPGMVEETADRDIDGNDLGTTTKSVKYSVFVPMLIKAMQEQQQIINDLKARLDAANL
jgi:hypothetical protein